MPQPPSRLTNSLIRRLNRSCEELRASGKCADDFECIHIGWCHDAWRMVDAAEAGSVVDAELRSSLHD